MTARSWAASGRRRDPDAGRPRRAPRPVGSWGAALERARASWDSLAGGPARLWVVRCECGRGPGPDGGEHGGDCVRERVYSDAAAAAILAAALGLWADTAAAMGEGLPEE
jgi:hypothetical protein